MDKPETGVTPDYGHNTQQKKEKKKKTPAMLLILKSGRIKVMSVTEEKVKSTDVYKY